MITDRQRRALVDLSDGEWRVMVPLHSRSVIQRLNALGLIRCAEAFLNYDERIWTITPDGLAALGVRLTGAH